MKIWPNFGLDFRPQSRSGFETEHRIGNVNDYNLNADSEMSPIFLQAFTDV